MGFVSVIILLLVGLLAYVRLAPSDAARWHVATPALSEGVLTGAGSHQVVIKAGEDTLAALNQIVMATPRTERLAGAPSEGRTTYITRSKRIGFPDYTTIEQRDDMVSIYSRLRFGKSDLGANKGRLEGWLLTLEK